MQYLQDYDNRFPLVDNYNNGGAVEPKNGPFGNFGGFWGPRDGQSIPNRIYPYLKSTQVFDCPSRNKNFDVGYSPPAAYAMNVYLTFSGPATNCYWANCGGATIQTPFTEAVVQQPARAISWIETAWTSVPHALPISASGPGLDDRYFSPAFPGNDIAAKFAAGGRGTATTDYSRHFEGCNVLFVDGHVKYMKRVSGIANASETGFAEYWMPWQP